MHTGSDRGNQSTGINDTRDNLIAWHGGNRKRVIGYGIADYSGNPSFPGKLAHRFQHDYPAKPVGPCGINSADTRIPEQFAAELGRG